MTASDRTPAPPWPHRAGPTRAHRAALLWGLVGLAGSAALPRPAAAQDEPVDLMAEPGRYTDVRDAADGEDPFDIALRLGFVYSSESATIERERTDAQTADARSNRRYVAVAEHDKTRNALEIGLEAGIYQDLMFFIGLPVVLSEEQTLEAPTDCAVSSGDERCERLTVPNAVGGREPLFDLSQPLRSAKRSGLPRFDLGVAWGVTNQFRGSRFANWVLRSQLSLPTGDLVEPCVRGGDSCDAGVADGKAALTLESRWSYRFRYVEPLWGISHTFQWVSAGEDLYTPPGMPEGVDDSGPPSITRLTVGAEVVPWEDRGRHQRFTFDSRASATLISGGRDISPLFDALGASPNDHLRAPNVSPLEGDSSDRDNVPFTGVTRVEAHVKLALRTSLVMQAARYVRFQLGLGLVHTDAHRITGEPACDTSVKNRQQGSCVQGLVNPVHRPVIDLPGQRFRVGDAFQVELLASATGQF